MDKRVQPLPLADAAVHLGGIGTCKNLARDLALSPELGESRVHAGFSVGALGSKISPHPLCLRDI